MMETEKTYVVSHGVSVTVNEAAFTPDFMSEFRESFYNFDRLDEHREHLAQLYARGIVDEFSDFIEGYGDPKEFGIKFASEWVEVDPAR